jgi:uncharacterized protein
LILADTSFWLALANRRDAHHAAAEASLEIWRGAIITTWPAVAESCQALAGRLAVDAAMAFVRSASLGAFEIFALERSHLLRVEELMEKYRAVPMDLTDASLVVLAEEIETGDILSADKRGFGAYRWKNRKPFRNLLLP